MKCIKSCVLLAFTCSAQALQYTVLKVHKSDVNMVEDELKRLKLYEEIKGDARCQVTQQCYEAVFSALEKITESSEDQTALLHAHYNIGMFAYAGYKPNMQSKKLGVDFKKALKHLTACVHCKTENTQLQAHAYFMMGDIYARGEKTLFGLCSRIDKNLQEAEKCFTLAKLYSEENSDVHTAATNKLFLLSVDALYN